MEEERPSCRSLKQDPVSKPVEALAAAAIDGLVVSLPGAGHAAAGAVPALAGLAERIPVVFASRTPHGAGETLRGSYDYPGGRAARVGSPILRLRAMSANREARGRCQIFRRGRRAVKDHNAQATGLQ
jgi:L-asparaginase